MGHEYRSRTNEYSAGHARQPLDQSLQTTGRLAQELQSLYCAGRSRERSSLLYAGTLFVLDGTCDAQSNAVRREANTLRRYSYTTVDKSKMIKIPTRSFSSKGSRKYQNNISFFLKHHLVIRVKNGIRGLTDNFPLTSIPQYYSQCRCNCLLSEYT